MATANNESLCNKLRNKKDIDTDLGKFIFKKQLGEGGNSLVFLFEREKNQVTQRFAIKFLKKINDTSSVSRFKDEFFCIQQLPTHKNLAQYYHFDKIKIDSEEYFIAIMKYYEKTLNDYKVSSQLSTDELEKGKQLLRNLLSAIKHMHSYEVIHRDIKPQNIFFDNETKEFVLGDMGIAKYPERLVRDAETRKSDRLANWLFSPKEQVNSKLKPEKNWDYFSIAQTIQWYFTGATTRGENRNKIKNPNGDNELKIIDDFITYCIQDNSENRPQSFEDIKNFLKKKEEKKHDYWKAIDELDKIIRKNFTKINQIEETIDKKKIDKFLSDFNRIIPLQFWMMDLRGGDWDCARIDAIDDTQWLTKCYEMDIEKLIAYRNDSIHKNFFLIVTAPGKRFEIHDNQGNILKSQYEEMDIACLWKEKSIYIDIKDIKNGYFETSDGKTIEVSHDKFPERCRRLNKFVYMIAPLGTPLNVSINRKPAMDLMENVLDSDTLKIEFVKEYEKATRGQFEEEIKKWL